jgi:tRNA-(ms[2]io[6]A)-hydroxylase
VLRLQSKTDPRFVDVALANLDALLVDHAHCEHKAAVTALSFVSKYPDDPVLVEKLAALAHEEAGHFKDLVDVLTARGVPLGHPEPDAYVQGLLAGGKKDVLTHRVERLLCCALIEGRSCERMQMLADGMRERGLALASLYDRLWREEAGHHTLFIELAERSLERAGVKDARAETTKRLDALAAREAALLASLPLRAANH